MQSFGVVCAIAAAAVVTAGTASAQSLIGSESRQGAPAPAATLVLRPVSWRCEGDQCGAGAPRLPSVGAVLRECEKVVGVIGPVSQYVSRGQALPPRELAKCNRYATTSPVAAQ